MSDPTAPKPRDPAALVAEARALSDAATPGPWEVDGRDIDAPWPDDQECSMRIARIQDHDADDPAGDDAAFIARARTLVPELATALEEATAALRAIVEQANTEDMVGHDDMINALDGIKDRAAAALGENGGVQQ